MEYKREELIALMREMEKQIALCHIRPQLAGALADELEKSDPVVRGKWTEKGNRIYDPILCDDVHWSTYICSECNGEVMKDFCYCPNCGAHMKDGDG